MTQYRLDDGDSLFFEHRPPDADSGITFVFFNALTGEAGNWEPAITPALRDAGHGSLTWNFRGQKDSSFSNPAAISASQIVADARALLAALAPPRPLFVGLSIGGLFAAQAYLSGAACDGMLLINTLRTPGPRLDWTNRAVHRMALTGGGRMIQDFMLPHITGTVWQAANAGNFLQDPPYAPLDPDEPTARLLAAGIDADWDLAWERLNVPVTVLSGLCDRVFHNTTDVAELTARLPDAASVAIADVGHLVTMERPEAVVEACLALVERLR